MVVGVDVAKTSVVAVVMDKSTRVKASYTVDNTKEDIVSFVESISNQYKKIEFASEATGEYHRTLALTCIEKEIPFRLLNPITTKQFTRATVRKRKTDLTDAVVIAKLALQEEGTLVTKDIFNLVKPTVRTAIKLSQMKQRLSLMQQHLIYIKMGEELTDSLENCMGILQEVEEQYQAYARMGIDTKLSSLLQGIPGIGEKIATVLISEIGSIERFPNGKSLVAYSGLDPKVKQSGGKLRRNTHLTKRGSPFLRRSIFFAASIAQMHDFELKTYHQKKRSEGRYYKEATVAVARKLLYRVYAVWKRQTPYIVRVG